jgi:pimeloyl-ACP methyl ester carboxylesterase
MKNLKQLTTIVVSFLLLLLTAYTSLHDEPPDGLIDIGSHRLYIHCVGEGNPTVVIEPGMGESYESWEPIMESLSQTTSVCAYDRAGYGQSDIGPMPRDSQTEADELHALLLESGVEGPYILVGHSLGGLNMQVFAASYPEQAAGAVLLDPSPLAWMSGEGFPELRELFRQEAGAVRAAADSARASSDAEEVTNVDFLETLASEFEQFFGNTAQQVAAINSFGDLPLTVIGASEPDPRFGESAQAFRQFWNEESRTLVGKSENGRFVLAEGSSHHIHLDAPQLVIDEIQQMVINARN